MNDAQIKAKLKAGFPGKFTVDRGLYFRVTAEGSGFWILRYTIHGKRREFTLGRYGKLPEGMPLADAKLAAAQTRAQVKQGVDPIAEKKRTELTKIKTVNDVAADWLADCKKRLENPQIPERVYRKDISPKIGELSINRANARDILSIIREINDSGRPTIANDALSYCKQLFNHAIKLGLISVNPALAFTAKDAGGTEKSRERTLSLEEVETIFRVFRNNSSVMTRENYLAIALLLVLGVRKGELIAAKWSEFDIEQQTWTLTPDRTKTGAGIVIPLPTALLPWLEELAVRANGSEYVFPSRRASRRRAYISDDTLNHALAKLFGKKVDSKKKPLPNLLGDAGIEHFVVHDLRRTCRSILAQNGIPSHIAERCLNHKLQGVEGIYDRYDYLEERRQALSQLADQITPSVGMPPHKLG
ncbi:MAG: site-specific integrase [Candidatus Thiodiazotropha sp.]|nr:site-specific integrase [Candidatus Thiodiazotropha sp.]MCM8922412.1 site-specific integrase [Candidatus Thiodiazotropha sp.]